MRILWSDNFWPGTRSGLGQAETLIIIHVIKVKLNKLLHSYSTTKCVFNLNKKRLYLNSGSVSFEVLVLCFPKGLPNDPASKGHIHTRLPTNQTGQFPVFSCCHSPDVTTLPLANHANLVVVFEYIYICNILDGGEQADVIGNMS